MVLHNVSCQLWITTVPHTVCVLHWLGVVLSCGALSMVCITSSSNENLPSRYVRGSLPLPGWQGRHSCCQHVDQLTAATVVD
jgi:hypothetical protein